MNVASLVGYRASDNNISNVASKFVVVGMTKAAALEYAKKYPDQRGLSRIYRYEYALLTVGGQA